MENIFCVMYATNVKGVEFAAYQLEDMAYYWYKKWDQARGDTYESSLWEDFSNAVLDRLFS